MSEILFNMPLPNTHSAKFYVSRSGRLYIHFPQGLQVFDRESSSWIPTMRTFEEVAADGRLSEVESADDFPHYARRAYVQQYVQGQ